MSNTRKSEVRVGGPDSSQTGCASSSDWVRVVGNTVIYPSLTNAESGEKPSHREKLNQVGDGRKPK